MRVGISVPIVATEQKETGETPVGGQYNINVSTETNLSIRQKYETKEEIAEFLVQLIETPQEYVQQMIPDNVREEYTVDTTQGVKINGMLSTASLDGVEAVYLAASELARKYTEQSMTRTGFSIEKILVQWVEEGIQEIAKTNGQEIEIGSFKRVTRNALFFYCVDQTPGQKIENTTIPEPKTTDKSKEEMLVDNT